MSNKYQYYRIKHMIENISYSAGTITYKQGTNASLAMRLKSDATTVIPLTGYSASLEVQKDYAARVNDCVIAGSIITDTTGNLMLFDLVPASLSAVRTAEEESSRIYQIKIVTNDDYTYIPLQGEFILIKDIS